MNLFENDYRIFVAVGIGGCLLSLALMILLIVSWWKIYDKMGEKGWKIFIPFYGRYVLFDAVWEGKVYYVSLILSIISCIITGIGGYNFYYSFLLSYGTEMNVVGIAGILIFAFIFFLANWIIQMILNWRIVRCFEHGIGFFIGLIFLPVIFIPILAFGKSEYDYY